MVMANRTDYAEQFPNMQNLYIIQSNVIQFIFNSVLNTITSLTIGLQMTAKIKGKPRLVIQTNSDDNQDCREVKFTIPRIKSVKNVHQLKKFNFNQVHHSPYQHEKLAKQDTIEKLQKEKAQLLESLQILKNGAVSAIVEKDQTIHKFRRLFNQRRAQQHPQNDDSKKQELQTLLREIQDLEIERNELKKQIQKQRKQFFQAIQERESVIQQLTYELNWSTQRIQNLQKYDALLEQKIKVIEESNNQLAIQLNVSQQNLKDERKKIKEQNSLLKNKSTSSIQHYSDSQGGNSSVFLNPRRHSGTNHFLSDSEAYLNISKSLDQYVVQSKIQQLNRQHQMQIQDLTDFYQSRIQVLKKICHQYPQQTYTNTNTNNTPKKYDINLLNDPDSKSNYSNFSNQTQQKEKSKEQERILKKNLSLGSFKSGNLLKMDPIDEKQQMELLPRKSLRKQLSNFNSQQQIPRASSQLSLGRQSSQGNCQNQSQFSYKYFEYPSSNFRKNKSQLNVNKMESGSNKKGSQRKSHYKNDWRMSTNQQNSKQSKQQKQQLWDKLFWFTSGTITGGLLLTVGHKLFKP